MDDLNDNSKDEHNPEEPLPLKKALDGSTNDTTDTGSYARGQDNKGQRVLLILGRVQIGDKTKSDTTASSRETTLRQNQHLRKSSFYPTAWRGSRLTKARQTKMVPQLGAKAQGICQMLIRNIESWRIGQRPNSSDQGAHSSQPNEYRIK